MYRSALMVAGDKERHLNKIESLECDIALINLEDGVYNKDYARDLVCEYLKDKKFNKKIVVRVNALDECGFKDIQTLNSIDSIDAIRVPKIKSRVDVERVCSLVKSNKEIHLSIETKEAFNSISSLKVEDRVTTLYLGILDLFADLGLSQELLTIDNPTVDYILSKFLIDSKSSDFYPISFVYQDYKNIDEFKAWCNKEKSMGFSGKGVISLDQVKIANEIFNYSSEVINRAKHIKRAFERSRDINGVTGFVDEVYGFIDEPIYKDALNILNSIK
jgi:citrate lyase subunit beta/citryl-CoA lyase